MTINDDRDDDKWKTVGVISWGGKANTVQAIRNVTC